MPRQTLELKRMHRLALITVLFLPAAVFAVPPQATIKTLAGESVSGRITALNPDKIDLAANAAARTLATADIMWVEFPQSQSTTEKATHWVELVDGSKLQAVSYTVSAGKAHLDLVSGLGLEIPTRGIRTVRFRQQTTPELAGQWREIVNSMATGDMVVIRKSTIRAPDGSDNEPGAGATHSLDQLEGTLLDVGPDSVQFEFDGEKINIRREKLDGLVYFQPAKREFSPPLARVSDSGGSAWLIRDLSLSGNHLTTTSLGGIAIEWPLAAVAKIDFSVGNIVFLSELEPDSGGGEPAISLQPASMANKFGRVFQLRAAPPLGADAFRIGGVRFDAGLSLHSPLTLVYRVPEGFRRFRAIAGVDDSVVSPGRFELVIRGDNQELLRQSFSGAASAEGRSPLSIDLDISRVRRITIVLDPADGQDIGDQLDLCEARFTK